MTTRRWIVKAPGSGASKLARFMVSTGDYVSQGDPIAMVGTRGGEVQLRAPAAGTIVWRAGGPDLEPGEAVCHLSLGAPVDPASIASDGVRLEGRARLVGPATARITLATERRRHTTIVSGDFELVTDDGRELHVDTRALAAFDAADRRVRGPWSELRERPLARGLGDALPAREQATLHEASITDGDRVQVYGLPGEIAFDEHHRGLRDAPETHLESVRAVLIAAGDDASARMRRLQADPKGTMTPPVPGERVIPRDTWTWMGGATAALAAFWGLWQLSAGSVPVLDAIPLVPEPIDLPFAVSRWWDILLGPFAGALGAWLWSWRQRERRAQERRDEDRDASDEAYRAGGLVWAAAMITPSFVFFGATSAGLIPTQEAGADWTFGFGLVALPAIVAGVALSDTRMALRLGLAVAAWGLLLPGLFAGLPAGLLGGATGACCFAAIALGRGLRRLAQ